MWVLVLRKNKELGPLRDILCAVEPPFVQDHGRMPTAVTFQMYFQKG